MKIKTADLTGPALDWAVEQCDPVATYPYLHFRPSTDWSQGGPIIEREMIETTPYGLHAWDKWQAKITRADAKATGPTPLIAAMRCYVTSKLGDEVEIPEELR